MSPNAAGKPRRIVFISSCMTVWGGSEELWGAAALALANDGHAITVLKHLVKDDEPHVYALRAAGVRVLDIDAAFLPFPTLTMRMAAALPESFNQRRQSSWMRSQLVRAAPDLVVLSQGHNVDGRLYATLCRQMNVSYAIVANKASEMYWPHDALLDELRDGYQSAARSFFVSEHNRRLTEEQLDADLPHAEVVRNPFLVRWEQTASWPREEGALRLACVGRLYPKEKGQDLLLRVLADTRRNR